MNSRLSLSDLRSNLHFAFPVTYRLMPKNIKKIKKNIIKYRKKSCLYLNEFVVFRDGKFPQIMICLAGEKPTVLYGYLLWILRGWDTFTKTVPLRLVPDKITIFLLVWPSTWTSNFCIFISCLSITCHSPS